MRMLLMGLNRLGFKDEAEAISSKRQSLPLVRGIEPTVNYQYALII